MCGRFVSATPPDAIAAQLDVDEVVLPDPPPPPRWNVAPTASVLAVAETTAGRRRLGMFEWGLRGGLFNARAETLLDKPSFRDAYRRRRCLIPADGFYEWRERRPVHVRRADGTPMVFAGLWEQGACTIVTTEANADVAPYHHRMPVVLERSAWDAWLDRSTNDAGVLGPLLRPASSGVVVVRPVRPLVNDVRRDGPELVEPFDPGPVPEQPSLLADP